MRAVSVRLHNFRTFADTIINLSPYTLLVGSNNCGKSNVIDAIRAFYEKGVKYEESRDFPKFPTSDKESWIEIQFRPSDEEFVLLKDDYRLPDGTFCVRKYLQSSESDSSGKPKTGIYAYVGGQLSDSRFYGAKNVQQGKFGEVIYIPAVSKLDEHTKLTGPSALRDLVNAILRKVMDASPAYDQLRVAFEEFEGGLKDEETSNGLSLTSLESEITREISEWDTSFQFFVHPVAPDLLVKNLIGHRLQDHKLGQPQDPKSCGQGFQRHLIFTLIKLAARHSSPTRASTRKDFSPQLTWILFEEPEAFLHPSQLDTLNASLRKVSQDVANQVLITTHNPQFVSKNIEDLPSLIRLCRTEPQSIANQIDSQTLNSILTANQKDLANWQAAGVGIHPDDLQIDMECIKYTLWLNPFRCSAFFANKVLLVEGPTETALFGHMFDIGEITSSVGGVFLLDCMGKWNIHRFMNILGALGIPHAVLYDYDGGKQADVEVEKTMQASRNAHTIAVDHFAQDLETFLGIPPAGKPHRKPQHIMWHLQQGNIDSRKLASLATKVETLLGI